MALIPAGCRESGYTPRTCFSAFWIDTTETRISAYESLAGFNPSVFHFSTYHACPTCPVDAVGGLDAVLFANKRTKQELSPGDTVYEYDSVTFLDTLVAHPFLAGVKIRIRSATNMKNLRIHWDRLGYRLPTYNEWLYAALPRHYYYPWADSAWNAQPTTQFWDADSALVYAWMAANSGNPGTSQPVAGKKPNQLGLYDVLGNVTECVVDLNPSGNVSILMGTEFKAMGLSAVDRDSWAGMEQPKAEGPSLVGLNGFRLVRNRATSTSVLPRKCIR